MNSTTYEIICMYAGPWLSRPHPWPIAATLPFALAAPAAVYAAFDGGDSCCYVGSVDRSTPRGLGDRIAEHLNDQRKRANWDHLWVVPLRPGVPRQEVRRIEGVVGAHLGPSSSLRLPRPRAVEHGNPRTKGPRP